MTVSVRIRIPAEIPVVHHVHWDNPMNARCGLALTPGDYRTVARSHATCPACCAVPRGETREKGRRIR